MTAYVIQENGYEDGYSMNILLVDEIPMFRGTSPILRDIIAGCIKPHDTYQERYQGMKSSSVHSCPNIKRQWNAVKRMFIEDDYERYHAFTHDGYAEWFDRLYVSRVPASDPYTLAMAIAVIMIVIMLTVS